MIIDVNFEDRHVLLIGGERETERKVHMFLDAGARVTLLCPFFPESLEAARREGRLTYIEGDMEDDPSLLERVKEPPYGVVVATAWESFLEEILAYKAKHHALLYVVDAAQHSDFIQPALRVVDDIQVAVSTGGQSPVMAARLAERFARGITKSDVGLCWLHDIVRLEAMERGIGALERRDLLRDLADDPAIRSLLQEGRREEARESGLARLAASG